MTTARDVLFTAPAPSGLLRRFGGLLRDFVRAAHEVERLFDCSDAELERRGLARSEVIPRVFGAHLERN